MPLPGHDQLNPPGLLIELPPQTRDALLTPLPIEERILKSVRNTRNEIYVHTDSSFMPENQKFKIGQGFRLIEGNIPSGYM